jgi:hypothetical protein
MIEQTKQHPELRQYREFVRAFPGAPLGEIHRPKPSEPDIVVTCRDGSVHAIELTDVNPGGPSR